MTPLTTVLRARLRTDLNDHQRAHLLAIFKVDQELEAASKE